MRKLDRKRVVAPDVLINPAGPGAIETTSAIAYYSKKIKPATTAPDYKAYRHPTVKKAVSDLSYDKCAYCESMVLAIDDGDVEHFRPKGLVTIEGFDPITTGYYWLAANWENLFLSCKHCNQSRTQPTPAGTKKTMGKKNQFPLSDNKKRIKTYKKKIAQEDPYRLLIDPSIEDPLQFLDFADDGMVSAKKFSNGTQNLKGEVSIEVFALYRKKLVDARKMQALQVVAALRTFKDHSDELNANIGILPKTYVDQKKIKLTEEIKNLNVYTRNDQLFSGMSLTIIKSFLEKMGISYKET